MQLEDLIKRITAEIDKVVFGQDKAVKFSLGALLCNGHILLEGIPGTAKTLLVRTIAKTLDMTYSRIQMTPDLLPNDITGSSVFHDKTREFEFKQGPVFSNFVLADEINRASARTQSALLESMQELTVTRDGISHKLPAPFMVFATQNPVEHEGTYPLPVAQLDRFMFKLIISYPEAATEERILKEHHATGCSHDLGDYDVEKVATREEVLEAKEIIRNTYVRDEVIDYVRRLVELTRHEERLLLGASPRAGLMLLVAAKSMARFDGRDFVTPDDVKTSFCPALRHRVILSPTAELEGLAPDDILARTMEMVEVPR